MNSLRKASTDSRSKQDDDIPELGPFGSTEALHVLNRATRLVLHCHSNKLYLNTFSNSHNSSARRLESFLAWEDDTAVAERRRSLRKKYPADYDVVVIELEKTCPTIG